jgi:adenylate kinase family enzyme
MQRVVIIGVTGSGKSTFAKQLAHCLHCDHHPMDDLRFLANWETKSLEDFRAILAAIVEKPAWVLDGNYSNVRDLTWGNADTVIWLNYSFPVAFRRLTIRTMRRILTGEVLFGGCVETFQSQFFSKDSLFLWFFQTYWKRRKEYPLLFQRPQYSHINFITLPSPRKAKKFLAQTCAAS